MTDVYKEIIDEAAKRYHAARLAARSENEKRAAAAAELASLTAELEGTKAKLTAFESGQGDEQLTLEEFTQLADRHRWLSGAVGAQKKIVKKQQELVNMANFELTNIHAATRNKVEDQLRREFEETAERRRAELRAAFDGGQGQPEKPWPTDPRKDKTVTPARF